MRSGFTPTATLNININDVLDQQLGLLAHPTQFHGADVSNVDSYWEAFKENFMKVLSNLFLASGLGGEDLYCG